MDFKKLYYPILILYLALPLALYISFVLNSEVYCYLFWLVVIGLIWLTDSMAYLIGSRWGKTKLLERISPKKTWEGFLGAGLTTIPAAWCAGALLLHDPSKFYFVSDWCVQNSGLFIALISVVVWIMGTLGDLFESCLKRYFKVKDSGHFMPGHGGMLDRFDSFIFILPFILLLLRFL
jgi:phosphatidate cytidylyltransferase